MPKPSSPAGRGGTMPSQDEIDRILGRRAQLEVLATNIRIRHSKGLCACHERWPCDAYRLAQLVLGNEDPDA